MKILLTRRAEKKLTSIKEFIAKKWGARVAQRFVQKTISLLSLLTRFPLLGTLEAPQTNIRAFQLSKHTKVFYIIRGDLIVITTFFDVRQNPDKSPGKGKGSDE